MRALFGFVLAGLIPFAQAEGQSQTGEEYVAFVNEDWRVLHSEVDFRRLASRPEVRNVTTYRSTVLIPVTDVAYAKFERLDKEKAYRCIFHRSKRVLRREVGGGAPRDDVFILDMDCN